MSNSPSDKTKAIFQKNLIKELKNILGSTSLLIESIKETNLATLTNAQKQYIYYIHTFTNSISKDHIPDIISSIEESNKNALRNANEKIRELELKNGESVDLSQASAFVNFTKNKIEKILSDKGLSVSVYVSVHAYSLSIKINFYTLRNWSFSDSYNITVEAIESAEKKKENERELFFSNFDVVKGRREPDANLASTDKNVDNILELMKTYDSRIQPEDIDVMESRNGNRYISEMTFTLSSDNIFLGERF